MSEVENQVVSMEFDNKNFEKNVKTSLSTLDRLKIGLATLTSSGAGILSFASTVKQVTFEPINNQVQIGIGKIMGLTAALTGVVNITDELYNITTKTIKSFTFDQITAGFSKYEEEMKGVQVIMNAVRKEGETEAETLARIEPQMEKLSWFADETSYDFTEMIANIGRFTAAGTSFDDTITAIMGIATWSAKAGGNAQTASTAMYQLSQALGRGAIHYEDWKSIMNLHMDTEEFKKQAIETAVAMGTLQKKGNEIFTKSGKKVDVASFTENLKQDWFTTEVFMKVATKYGSAVDIVLARTKETGETASEALRALREEGILSAEDIGQQAFQAAMEAKTLTEALESIRVAVASKFSRIYKAIFGNFIEARDLWTTLSEKMWTIFAGPIDAVADLMEKWKEAGGRVKIFKSLSRIFNSIAETFSVINEMFHDIFGRIDDPAVFRKLNGFTDKFDVFSIRVFNILKDIRSNQKLLDSIESFFSSIKKILDALQSGLKVIRDRIILPFINIYLPKIVDKLADVITKVSEFITKIADFIVEYDLFNKIIDYSIELYKDISEHVSKLSQTFSEITSSSSFMKLSDNFKNIAKNIEDAGGPLEYFKNVFKDIISFISDQLGKISPYLSTIWEFLVSIFTWLGRVITNIGPSVKTAMDFIKGVLDSIKQYIDEFIQETSSGDKSGLEVIADWIAGGIKYLLSKLEDVDLVRLNLWLDAIQKIVWMIIEIALTIKILAYRANSRLDFTAIFNPIYGLFKGIAVMFSSLMAQANVGAAAGLIGAIAFAMLSMAGSLLLIATIPTKDLEKAMVAMIVMTHIIGGVTAAVTIIIDRMSQLEKIATVNLSKLFKGEILGLADSLSAKIGAIAGVIATLGIAILLMSISMKIIDGIDAEKSFKIVSELLIMLAGIVVSILSLMAVSNSFNKSNVATLTALIDGFTKIAIAVLIMAFAMNKISNIKNPLDALVVVIDLVGLMTGMLFAFKGLGLENKKSAKNVAAYSKALVTMSIAMLILASALKILGNMDTDSMIAATGMMAAMMGTLTVLIGISSAFGNYKSILAVGITMDLVAAAILAIAAVLFKIIKIKNPELVNTSIMQLERVAWSLIGLMTVLVFMSRTLLNKKQELDKDKLLALAAVATVLVAMSVPLMAISASIMGLAFMANDSGNLIQAATSIGIILVAITAVLKSAKNFRGAEIGSMFAVAGAIAVLSSAIMILAPALAIISKLNMSNLVPIITTLSLVALLTVKALSIMGGDTNLLIIAGFLDMMAASVLMLSGAVILFALGLEKLIDQLVRIVNIKPEDIKNLIDNVRMVIADMLTDIPWATVFTTFDTLVAGYITTLMNNQDMIVSALSELLNSIIDAVIELLRVNFPAIIALILTLLPLLEPLVLAINEFLYSVTKDLFGYIIDLLKEYVPKLNEQIEEATWDLFMRVLKLLNHGVPLLNAELAAETMNLIYWLNIVIVYLGETIVKGTIKLLEILRDNADQFSSLLIEAASLLVFGLLEGLIELIPLLTEKVTALVTALLELFETVSETVVETNWDEIEALIDDFMDRFTDAFIAWIDKQSEVDGALFKIVKHIFLGLFKAYDYYVQKTSWYNPFMWAQKIGRLITTGISSVLQIHSPSKVMEKIGGFVIEGLSNGLSTGFSKVGSIMDDIAGIISTNFSGKLGTFKEIGGNLKDALLGGIAKELNMGSFDFGSVLDGYMNLNPTITPQLDLSNVESGIANMDTMFANSNIQAAAADYGRYLNPMEGYDSVTQVEWLKTLSDKISDFVDVHNYNSGDAPTTNVQVFLEGDAKKMLKVLSAESIKQTKATNVNPISKVKYNY